MANYASQQEGQTVTIDLHHGHTTETYGQIPTAMVTVPALARIEIASQSTKCLFDAYCGRFEIEECKGQIPSHIASTDTGLK